MPKQLTKGCFLLSDITGAGLGAYCLDADYDKDTAKILQLSRTGGCTYAVETMSITSAASQYRIIEYHKVLPDTLGTADMLLGARLHDLLFDSDGVLSSVDSYIVRAVQFKEGKLLFKAFAETDDFVDSSYFSEYSKFPSLSLTVTDNGLIPMSFTNYQIDTAGLKKPTAGDYGHMVGRMIYGKDNELLGLAYALTATGIQLDTGILIPLETLKYCRVGGQEE